MIYKRPAAKPGIYLVTFELPAQFWAERIYLVGDFNDWDQAKDRMEQDGPDGNWTKTVELEAGREYQFRYLADGQFWHNDNAADRYEDNQRGSTNSVVVLPPLDTDA